MINQGVRDILKTNKTKPEGETTVCVSPPKTKRWEQNDWAKRFQPKKK